MENLYALLYGLLGTALMSFVLYGVQQAGGPSAANVRGIGSSVPTPHGGSLVPGAAAHIVAGALFGLVYLGLGHAWASLAPGSLLALGIGVGLVRGLAVTGVLSLLAFDQRPMERIQLAGAGTFVVHALGNVVYGLALAVLFGLSRVDSALAF